VARDQNIIKQDYLSIISNNIPQVACELNIIKQDTLSITNNYSPKAKWTLVNIHWHKVKVKKLTKWRSEYKNWRFWLVEKLIILHYIHPASAWLLSSPSLPSRQENTADSCWVNFSYIQKTSRYLNRWRIFKMTAVALGPKIFSRTLIQGF